MALPKRQVYLIHFSAPLAHARHYLGSTSDIEARMDRHYNGRGSRIMQVVSALNIGLTIARTWHGGYKVELQLKKQKNTPRMCPICNPQTWSQYGKVTPKAGDR